MKYSVQRVFVLCSFILVCTSQSALAGQMTIEYQGVTKQSTIDGVSIPDGTSFNLKVVSSNIPFDDSLVGKGSYEPLSMTADVGGTSYQGDISGFSILLSDDTSALGSFAIFLMSGSFDSFLPIFSGSTADPWFAQSPTSTTFSDYSVSIGTGVYVRSPLHELFLAYDNGVGVGVSINVVPDAIPEPSSLALLVFGGISLGTGAFFQRNSVAV